MSEIIHTKPADSPGYVHVTLAEPVGTVQGGVLVLIDHSEHRNELQADPAGTRHEIGRSDGLIELYLHGQREFDVLEGSTITFPDGTTAEV